MARGGARPGAGAPRGPRGPNKITRQRLAEVAKSMAAAKAMENPYVQAAVETLASPAAIEQAQAAGRKIGKSILDDFANVLAGMAAYYQPTPNGINTHADEKKFLQYTELAIYAAEKVAQYQSPKLSALMVGTAQTKKIEVMGGLPSPDAPPALTDEQYRRAIEATEAGAVIEGKAETAPAPELVPTGK